VSGIEAGEIADLARSAVVLRRAVVVALEADSGRLSGADSPA